MAEMDGGVEAITGFVVQSLAALLDSLRRTDWVELAIDPASDDGTFQKVDLFWKLTGGRIEVAQVKSSRNNISVPDAKNWANELRASAHADLYRLILFAPTTGGGPGIGKHDGVSIEVAQGDVSALWGSLAWSLYKFLSERRRLCHPEVVGELARLIVGRTIVGAHERKSWSPSSLETLLLSLADVSSQQRPGRGMLEVNLLRIVKGDLYESCVEYLRYTLTNPGNVDLRLGGWQIVWTDAEDIRILGVSDGLEGNPEYHEIIDDASGALELCIVPRSQVIPPKGFVIVSVEVRRSCAFQRVDGTKSWIFHDRLLATEFSHQADVFVIFPCSGALSAPGVSRAGRSTVHWRMLTGREHRRLCAVLNEAVPGVAEDELLVEVRSLWPSCPE